MAIRLGAPLPGQRAAGYDPANIGRAVFGGLAAGAAAAAGYGAYTDRDKPTRKQSSKAAWGDYIPEWNDVFGPAYPDPYDKPSMSGADMSYEQWIDYKADEARANRPRLSGGSMASGSSAPLRQLGSQISTQRGSSASSGRSTVGKRGRYDEDSTVNSRQRTSKGSWVKGGKVIALSPAAAAAVSSSSQSAAAPMSSAVSYRSGGSKRTYGPKRSGRRSVRKTGSKKFSRSRYTRLRRGSTRRRYGLSSTSKKVWRLPTTQVGSTPSSTTFSTNIKRSEYISDIRSATNGQDFFLSQYAINAGLPNTFPWLSQLAGAFEFVHWNSLTFEFKTSVGTGVTGKVILATDYDNYDQPFATKSMMEQEAGVAVGPVYATSIKHKVQTRGGKLGGLPIANFYIRQGPIPTGSTSNATSVGGASATQNSDQNFYDLGQFQIAVQGCSSNNTTLGELWVHYDVDLIRPQAPVVNGMSFGWQVAGVSAASTDTFVTLPGSAQTWNIQQSGATINIRYIGGNGGVFQILLGSYTSNGSTTGGWTAVAPLGTGSNGAAAALVGTQDAVSTTITAMYRFTAVMQPQAGASPGGNISNAQGVTFAKPAGMTSGNLRIMVTQLSPLMIQ